MTKDELKKLLGKKDITFNEKDKEIAAKFSGLTSDSINFWTNYYLNAIGSNLLYNSRKLEPHDYDNFSIYLKELLKFGDVVGVSATRDSNVMMIEPRTGTRVNISSNTAGHMMTVRGLDASGNLVVDSYGKNFIIAKQDIDSLEYQVVTVRERMYGQNNVTKQMGM